MEHFDVSGNAFTGAVPTNMEGWISLRHFDVSGNQLTAVFLATPQCSMDSLKVLKVARNNLTGTVSLGELPAAMPFAGKCQLLGCRTLAHFICTAQVGLVLLFEQFGASKRHVDLMNVTSALLHVL
jgi:hypothetical protein